MARISSYGVVMPDGKDLLLGTDVAGSQATKNFKVQDVNALTIEAYLKTNSWKFTTNFNEIKKSSILFDGGGGDFVPFDSITSIIVNTLMVNNTDSLPYLEYLLADDPQNPKHSKVDNEISLFNRKDLGSFGTYILKDVQPFAYSGISTLYELTLEHVSSSGVIENDNFYGLGLDPLNAQDKTLIYTQSIPATTWTIDHGLKKFPSVTVVDSANSVVQGTVSYNSATQITLTFSAAFSGQAFLN